jgi:ATP-dependent exoDNAse (exonuclease V) beta subunit
MQKQRHHILFDEKSHTYKNTVSGEYYISVTKLLSRYYPKFDADAIANNLISTHPKYRQQYQDIPIIEAVEMLKNEWNKRTNIGNLIHSKLEDHLKGISIFEPDKPEKFNDRLSQLLTAWENLNLKGLYQGYEFCPELLIFSDKHKIAGQADLILLNHSSQSFIIFDYKTNKKGISKSAFGNKMMFEPVDHLPDCNYSHYSLQLNIYAHFLAVETGYKCEDMALLWIDTNQSRSVGIDRITVNPMTNEVRLLLQS